MKHPLVAKTSLHALRALKSLYEGVHQNLLLVWKFYRRAIRELKAFSRGVDQVTGGHRLERRSTAPIRATLKSSVLFQSLEDIRALYRAQRHYYAHKAPGNNPT